MVCPRRLYYTAKRVLVILCHIGMLVFCFQATQSTTVQHRVSQIALTCSNLFHAFVHLQFQQVPVLSCCAHLFIDGRFAPTLALAFWAEYRKSE